LAFLAFLLAFLVALASFVLEATIEAVDVGMHMAARRRWSAPRGGIAAACTAWLGGTQRHLRRNF
jgi:hypothetical protein